MSDASMGLWVTDPEAYRREMFDLVGGRDPLQIMSQTPDALRQIVAAHPVEKWPARSPASGRRARSLATWWTPSSCMAFGGALEVRSAQ